MSKLLSHRCDTGVLSHMDVRTPSRCDLLVFEGVTKQLAPEYTLDDSTWNCRDYSVHSS